MAKDPDDDRSFGRGNPFARALRPEPDDDKATSPGMYVLFGLLSLVLIAIFIAAMVLPPLFTYSLIVRGARTGRWGMLTAGVVMGFFYALIFFALGKRLMGAQRSTPPTEDE